MNKEDSVVLGNVNMFNECMRNVNTDKSKKKMFSSEQLFDIYENDIQFTNIISLMFFYLFLYFGLSNLVLSYLGYQLFKTPSKRVYYIFSGFLFYYFHGFLSTLYILTCLSSYYMLNNTIIINYYNSYLFPKKNILITNFSNNLNNLMKIKIFTRLSNSYNFIFGKINYIITNYYVSRLINNLDKGIGYVFLYIKNGLMRLFKDLSFSIINLFNKFDLKKSDVINSDVINSSKKNDNTFFIDEFDNLDDLLMNDDELSNFRDNNMNQQMDMLLNMMGKAQNLMSQVNDLKSLDKNNLRRRNNINNISI
tara:strand:- start:29 stop:952 length:924 start_codon:yes stop_codon:yes gene_type:complete